MFQDNDAPEIGEWTARSWDVRLPPPSSSMKGQLVPKVLNAKMRSMRRVSIEDHGSSSPGGLRAVYIKIFVRGKRTVRRSSSLSQPESALPNDDDVSLSPSEYSGLTERDDGINGITEGVVEGNWKEKYSIPIENIKMVKNKKRTVVVDILRDGRSTKREIIFEDGEQADEFKNALNMKESMRHINIESVNPESALGVEEPEENEDLLIPESPLPQVQEFSAEQELAENEEKEKKEPTCIQMCVIS
mmetsp:Transcript_4286/g.8315  ORF Transcript_4286/g.8315 Transcript_4286/m.8315 type:complete len:246 (-) Transcript_4286:638-1375(-)